MASKVHVDATTTDENHNASHQRNVIVNDDPALEKTQEHNHSHLHHDVHAEKGRSDEVLYSKGTTDEKSTIPHQGRQDRDLARREQSETTKDSAAVMDFGKADSGSEADPQTHTWSNFYRKYRLFFHIFIWLVFTGLVKFLSAA